MAQHTPVLVEEVLHQFQAVSGDSLLDATLGHGGHAKAYLQATAPDGTVTGFDADPGALAVAKDNLQEYEGRVAYINANFHTLKDSLSGGGIVQDPLLFNHILFDLGIGSHQLADQDKGFSFQSKGKLTMKYGEGKLPPSMFDAVNRIEQKIGRVPDASDIIEHLSQEELQDVISKLSEERFAKKIAAALKEEAPETGKQAAECIAKAVPAGYEKGRIHPATRTFQALRLAVNRELEVLEKALPQAFDLLAESGVMVVISFHSLEDRVVKKFFQQLAKGCICPPESPVCTCGSKSVANILTKKPVTATEEEIVENPRSRSAKLRAIKRVMR